MALSGILPLSIPNAFGDRHTSLNKKLQYQSSMHLRHDSDNIQRYKTLI
jgi:hypothetical protein